MLSDVDVLFGGVLFGGASSSISPMLPSMLVLPPPIVSCWGCFLLWGISFDGASSYGGDKFSASARITFRSPGVPRVIPLSGVDREPRVTLAPSPSGSSSRASPGLPRYSPRALPGTRIESLPPIRV
ncbi:hypothetical protein BJ508DRAFT_72875 [Ascobolus immersus RN42]|uniref:Uncharacterized protein n=1 Tax=Ascobolus immersus RN42 TaxID=1160509 RepID=A0A3N4HE45_ASCIM|nr:hypothetical protein BJ508DRAFT_72875 [Ascobolus immersus RN42]